jgi:hypothetical protein
MPNKNNKRNNTKKNNKRNNTKKNKKNTKKNNYKPMPTSLCGPCPRCGETGYIVGTTGNGSSAMCECPGGHRYTA